MEEILTKGNKLGERLKKCLTRASAYDETVAFFVGSFFPPAPTFT